jgi:hypothetical protein
LVILFLMYGNNVQDWGVGWAAATRVLWGFSYIFWRRLQATPASP